MRHNKAGKRLGRTASHKKAMIRNMVTSLLAQERIVTTVPKAKEVRRIADKMITLGKRGDLHARRQALSFIRDKKVLPSMRALQFAGPAMEVNNARGYNCAYLPVDSLYSFSETMFLLLGGSGVGFSVQKHHVEQGVVYSA